MLPFRVTPAAHHVLEISPSQTMFACEKDLFGRAGGIITSQERRAIILAFVLNDFRVVVKLPIDWHGDILI